MTAIIKIDSSQIDVRLLKTFDVLSGVKREEGDKLHPLPPLLQDDLNQITALTDTDRPTYHH